MKPLWYQANGDAELEALQTDVMRFIAILGLCLAAIFSLVQGTATEEAKPEPSPIEKPLPLAAKEITMQVEIAAPANVAEENVPLRSAVPEMTIEPATPAPLVKPELGYSLEFASDAALLELLETAQLSLYAKVEGHFWVLDTGTGTFTSAAAPGSYYQMLVATVPQALRRDLQQVAGLAAGEWGVQLAPAMVQELQRILRQRSGGALLIQASGKITLEMKE